MKHFRFLFKDRGFAYKFTLLTTFPVIIVAVSIALQATQTLEQSVTRATNVRVMQNTSLAALSMSNPYVIYNKSLLDSFVDNLKQESDIIYAIVVDYNDGRILVHSDHTKDGQYYKPAGSGKIQITGTAANGISQFPGIGFEAVSPIRISGDLFGAVRVGFTLDAVSEKTAELRLKILGITILAISFSIFLSVFLARLLSKPILSLESQAQMVAAGDFEQEITYDSQDVVGRLAKAFKTMTDKLKKRIHIIETNEKKYRSLFEASNDAVLILNKREVIDCNKQTLRLFKCDLRDIQGRSMDRVFPKEQPNGYSSVERFNHRLKECLAGRRHRFYWKLRCFDKTEIDTEISLSPTVIVDKNRVLAVVQDITERKAAEAEIENFNQTLERKVDERTKELQDAQEAMLNLVKDLNRSQKDLEIQKVYLEQLFRTSPEALVQVNEFDQVVRVNKHFSKIFGFSKEEVKGKSLDLSIIPESKRKEGEMVKKNVVLGKTSYFETKRLRKDGSLVDVSITGMPITIDGENKGAYAIYRDISDRKKAEKDLKDAQAAAEAANRAKGEFLANMSHEIRTPLNAIVGLTYLTKQTDLTAHQYEYLMKIDSSAEALLTVINDILDFSKIEAGKLAMESVEFYLEDVLNKVADMVAVKADEKGLELVFVTEDDTPQELIGDPLRLAQVLVNLIGNAIKFTETGEVVVQSRLVEIQGQKVILRFEIRDTGIGLSREHKKNLFRAFSQADTSTTRRFGGTGLGLVICKRIVDMMGGDIDIESELGKGSTFGFTIALGQHNKKRENPLLETHTFEGKSALVVDDSRTARITLNRILGSLKLDVTLADSGQEALKIMEMEAKKGKHFDIVFTDYKMPLMDGLETLRQIKNSQEIPSTPILIMVTAYGRDVAIQQAEHLDLDGIINKPVTSSTILDCMMATLGKKYGYKQKSGLMSPKAKQGLAGINGSRILLAEDNVINQQVACELLSSVGVQVSVVNNGKEVMKKLKQEKFDAILMDVQMPVMDGLTAAKKIRAIKGKTNDIPIIALTAHAMVGDRDKSLRAGMNDHITKPLDPEALFEVLVKWIKPINNKNKGPMAPLPLDTQKAGSSSEKRLPHKLPGIDIVSALARVGGNQKAFIQLIHKFVASHANAVDVIADYLKNAEYQNALGSAHALKGVSGNIGAAELHKMAKLLEQSIKEDRKKEFDSLLDSMRLSMKRVLESSQLLNASMQDKPDGAFIPGEPKNLDKEKIITVLSDIKQLLQANHFNSRKHIERLDQLLLGSIAKKEMAELKKNVDRYRFKDALSSLETLSNVLEKIK